MVAGFPVETSAKNVIVSYGDQSVLCLLPEPIGMVMGDQFDAHLAGQAACLLAWAPSAPNSRKMCGSPWLASWNVTPT